MKVRGSGSGMGRREEARGAGREERDLGESPGSIREVALETGSLDSEVKPKRGALLGTDPAEFSDTFPVVAPSCRLFMRCGTEAGII